MAFWDLFLNTLWSIFIVLWNLFVSWMGLFLSPLTNFDLLWITIPIWISWFVGDYFQEKNKTSFGNAIANGVIPVVIGLDWTRYLVTQLTTFRIFWSVELIVKFIICVLVLVYGIMVIYYAVRARKVVQYLGRIREVTYILLMFTPIIYGAVQLTWLLVAAMILYFPLWYFGIELLFKVLPVPKAMRRDV